VNYIIKSAIVNMEVVGGPRGFVGMKRVMNAMGDVLDNIRIAHYSRVRYGVVDSVVRSRQCRQEEAEIEKQAMELLDIFGVASYAEELAKNLPYGEQRRVEIARALAVEPRLLLLDEPAAGMNLAEREHHLRGQGPPAVQPPSRGDPIGHHPRP